MLKKHQLSPCCGSKIYKNGSRRRKCSKCGTTWRINKHKRGRKTIRTSNEIVKHIIYDNEGISVHHRRVSNISKRAFSYRFEKQLIKFIASTHEPLKSNDRYALMVDGLWFTFKDKQWTLYMMALKPIKHNYVHLLDPVMLEGKESANGWTRALKTIPKQVDDRIDGFVSDNLAGLTTVAKKYGVHQLCHFHLLKEVKRRLGRRRPNHTTARSIREKLFKYICIFLESNEKQLKEVTDTLEYLTQQEDCPYKLKMVTRTLLRRSEQYMAYKIYPELNLPKTTGVMESLGAQIRLRVNRLKTPESVERWAKVYVRCKSKMKCISSTKLTS